MVRINFSFYFVYEFIAYIVFLYALSFTLINNKAAWKIIKNWLPPSAVNLIKFCDKKSIKEFIQDSQLFTHMGGTVSYLSVKITTQEIIKHNISFLIINRIITNTALIRICF